MMKTQINLVNLNITEFSICFQSLTVKISLELLLFVLVVVIIAGKYDWSHVGIGHNVFIRHPTGLWLSHLFSEYL